MFAEEGSYYGKTLGKESFSFEWVIDFGDNIFSDMKTLATSPDPLPDDYLDKLRVSLENRS